MPNNGCFWNLVSGCIALQLLSKAIRFTTYKLTVVWKNTGIVCSMKSFVAEIIVA